MLRPFLKQGAKLFCLPYENAFKKKGIIMKEKLELIAKEAESAIDAAASLKELGIFKLLIKFWTAFTAAKDLYKLFISIICSIVFPPYLF